MMEKRELNIVRQNIADKINTVKNNIAKKTTPALVVLAGSAALAGCGGDRSGGAGFTDREAGSYNLTVPESASIDPSRVLITEDGQTRNGFINEVSQPQIDFMGSPKAFTDKDCGSIVFPVVESEDSDPRNLELTGQVGKDWEGQNGQSCVYPNGEEYLSGEGQEADKNRQAALDALDTIAVSEQYLSSQDY